MTPVMKAINIMTKHEINKAIVDLPMSVKKYRKYSKIKKNCEREEENETSVCFNLRLLQTLKPQASKGELKEIKLHITL